MSFGDAVHSVLSKYVCFTGRARRSEYWYFILFEMIVSAALTGVLNFIGARESTVEGLTGLMSAALLLPGLGVILFLIWMCRDGDRGPNAYGPDPKDPGAGWPESGRDPWEY